LIEETTFIFRSKVEPGSRFWEGLRLSAAFIGMDHIPVIVFMDDAILGLKHNALPLRQLWDYLKTTSDLAGINVLDLDMEKIDLKIADLDHNLNVNMITLDELAERLPKSRVVATF